MSWSWMVRIVGAKAVNINSGAAVWPVHFGSVAVPALFFVIISLSFISIFIVSLVLYTVICSCFSCSLMFCAAICVASICLFCMFVICSSSVALCLFSTRIHILFIYSQKHRHNLDSQRAVSIQLFIKQRNLKRQKKRSYVSEKHKKPEK